MIRAIILSLAMLFVIMLSVVMFSVLPSLYLMPRTNLNITWPSVGLGFLTYSPNVIFLYLRKEMSGNYKTL